MRTCTLQVSFVWMFPDFSFRLDVSPDVVTHCAAFDHPHSNFSAADFCNQILVLCWPGPCLPLTKSLSAGLSIRPHFTLLHPSTLSSSQLISCIGKWFTALLHVIAVYTAYTRGLNYTQFITYSSRYALLRLQGSSPQLLSICISRATAPYLYLHH